MQFVYMCEDLLMKKDIFETQFKSDFLKLALDHVVDVRLALAKVLRSHFNEIEGPFVFDKDINMAVRLLQQDKSTNVSENVKEIQTFPHNEDFVVTKEIYVGYLDSLKGDDAEMEMSAPEEEEKEEKKEEMKEEEPGNNSQNSEDEETKTSNASNHQNNEDTPPSSSEQD